MVYCAGKMGLSVITHTSSYSYMALPVIQPCGVLCFAVLEHCCAVQAKMSLTVMKYPRSYSFMAVLFIRLCAVLWCA